ncbi:MAG: VWA domain-containing protein, partial [Phycisphaeraceae bacterium]
VTPEQEFLVAATLRAPTAQQVRYELSRGDRVIAGGTRDVAAGQSRLTFRDAVQSAGTASYTLRIRGEGDDPQLENNTARLLVGVEGRRPILLVSEKADPPLARLLRAGGLDVSAIGPSGFVGDLGQLGGYSAVVLEDVPARSFGNTRLANMAQWVQHAGGGLLMTGGPHSFGAGGYFEGPLDPVLPVSMELRQEHRKLATAMVLVIDRSGSMSGEPLAMAREASIMAVDMLTPVDEVGVVIFDGQAHIASSLQSAGNAGAIKHDISRIQSAGGTNMYSGMVAARNMLRAASTQNRHVIVLSDGQTPDADHLGLVDELRQMNATVSTVALGAGVDRQL